MKIEDYEKRISELNEMCYELESASKKQDMLLVAKMERIYELETGLKQVLKYFTSANDVEVERATILTSSKEIQELRRIL